MVKITITEDRITSCEQCGRLAARLSTETARANRAEDALNNSLMELEKSGWPCRLEELPAMYVEVATRMTTAEKQLTEAEGLLRRVMGHGAGVYDDFLEHIQRFLTRRIDHASTPTNTNPENSSHG